MGYGTPKIGEPRHTGGAPNRRELFAVEKVPNWTSGGGLGSNGNAKRGCADTQQSLVAPRSGRVRRNTCTLHQPHRAKRAAGSHVWMRHNQAIAPAGISQAAVHQHATARRCSGTYGMITCHTLALGLMRWWPAAAAPEKLNGEPPGGSAAHPAPIRLGCVAWPHAQQRPHTVLGPVVARGFPSSRVAEFRWSSC